MGLTFFVGLYNDVDFGRVMKHQGHGVIVFCGSDAFKLRGKEWWRGEGKVNFIRRVRAKKLSVVSISDDITEALSAINVPSRQFNVCPTMESRFRVVLPSSKTVYVYYNDAHKNLFDWGLYEGLVKHYEGSDVTIEDVHSKVFVNPLDMPKVYENCFVGMKPYLKDGYGNTQVELALSGRRCISNGQFGGSLRYSSLEDAIAHIDNELKNVNSMKGRQELRTLAEKELQLPEGFNQIEFWV
jgi:hypothetical protein